MRPAVATLAILTIGGPSFAFADPPATPVPAESGNTATPNGHAEDSTGQNGAAHTAPARVAATAAETPAVVPAKSSTPSASAESQQEQLLRFQGYQLRMVRGQVKYCRREMPLGSRLPTVLHCVTVAEADAMAREGKEVTERVQRNTSGCLSSQAGSCGH